MSWVRRLVCIHPDQIQQLLTFRLYTFNLFKSRGPHEIFWQISSVDILPKSSSFFQDLIIPKRDFWCWACNQFNCIQLVILFKLFTKCFQKNRCYQFWRGTCSTTWSASQDSSNFSPKLPSQVLQSSSPRLCWFSHWL